MELGPKVRERRVALGFSQEELARKAGISLNAAHKIEAGRITDPHFSTLTAIAHALGTTVDALVSEDEPEGALAGTASGKAEAPQESGQPEAPAQTVEEFERKLAHVLEPADTGALREWQASNRLESSQRKVQARIVDPPEAAVAERFVEEFSPEEWPLAFAEVGVGHARHKQAAEALRNNMAALRKESSAELKKKDQRIADLEAETAQLKEGAVRMRQENARLRQDIAELRSEAEREGTRR